MDSLVLGTVELGMPYGLNARGGQPSREESFAILDAAYAARITTFDTAYAYGSAEEVLGAWIAARGLADSVRVISKLRPHVFNDYAESMPRREIVRTEVEQSLARLGLPRLAGYLFHSPHYIYDAHALAALRGLKDAGLVERVGVSTYDEAEALQAAALGVDLIQVPYNVFDQRLDRTDFWKLAQDTGVEIYARSPFLQGLLLMRPDELPPHLAVLAPELGRFRALCAEHDTSAVRAALGFVAAAHPEAHIVFGVNARHEAEEDVATAPIAPALFEELRSEFAALNRGAINPSLWSKIR